MLLGRLILEGNPHTADIVFAVAGVQAEKMAVEAFAEPIAELRHHRPEFEFTVLVPVERPGIVIAGQFERGPLAQAGFEARIERSGRRPMQRIGLDSEALRSSRTCRTAR